MKSIAFLSQNKVYHVMVHAVFYAIIDDKADRITFSFGAENLLSFSIKQNQSSVKRFIDWENENL
jgi:hypothetical protein